MQIWDASPDYITIYIKNINRKQKGLRKLALLEEQQAKFTSLFQGLLQSYDFSQCARGLSLVLEIILFKMTPLFNIINSYNVILQIMPVIPNTYVSSS